eukprot:345575-Pyramimonas_sp.AAC.1
MIVVQHDYKKLLRDSVMHTASARKAPCARQCPPPLAATTTRCSGEMTVTVLGERAPREQDALRKKDTATEGVRRGPLRTAQYGC